MGEGGERVGEKREKKKKQNQKREGGILKREMEEGMGEIWRMRREGRKKKGSEQAREKKEKRREIPEERRRDEKRKEKRESKRFIKNGPHKLVGLSAHDTFSEALQTDCSLRGIMHYMAKKYCAAYFAFNR